MARQSRLPWLALLTSLLFLAIPAVRLSPLVDCTSEWQASAGNSVTPLTEVGRSAHFRLLTPEHYLSPGEIQRFLERAEENRRQLVAYMSPVEADRMIDIHIHPEAGVARSCAPTLVELYGVREGHNDLVHELTHCLMPCQRSFLSEGLAVAMEERFGWGVSALTRCRPVNAYLHAFQRAGQSLEPLSALWDRPALRDATMPERTPIGYLEAGSFVNFLLDRYGWDAFAILYERSSFELAYGQTLPALEAEWRASLRLSHFIQGLAVTAGGLAVLAMAHVASRDSRWSVAGTIGLAAFDLWANYLVYPLLLPGLISLVVIGTVCLSRFAFCRRPLLALSLGGCVFVWLVLGPAAFPPGLALASFHLIGSGSFVHWI